ncbi:uncharacterized protein BO72DRAFT_493782 [Aspergillus fijiensis CBS 313.89]|uniref:Protein kinase domain-containing protein n=1 Tax=Aspergillus fijiensis CBS 313.89 TaxID=1448319 RepID=A0A8G1RYI5_9EURO|nr:uncharacterized protein BO72DRAFT_493782 [Aspergillus fijiensis CBS 313.89]RAK79946.1 hypothetical protein BO72DRAFT_493782 [Aspergillus fijiensis CBS 313.89]
MPSPIQKLFCRASAIPTLLSNVDQFKAESQDSSLAEENVLNARALKFSFVSALTNLNEMENELTSQGHRPCQPPPSNSKSVESKHLDRVLWFPGITSANALVYLWTFKIICMTELRELAEFSAPRHIEDEICFRDLSPASLKHQIIELAVLICQSMEYCIQDEMALYGPASAIYPLRIAHKILKSATNYGAHTKWFRQILEAAVLIHSFGVIHSDLALRQILVDDTLDLRLGDFNSSQCTGPPALGHEKASHCLSRDYELDILVLGSTLYELVAGGAPYSELNPNESDDPDSIKAQIRRQHAVVDIEMEDRYRKQQFPVVTDVRRGDIILGCWKGQFATAQEALDRYLQA